MGEAGLEVGDPGGEGVGLGELALALHHLGAVPEGVDRDAAEAAQAGGEQGVLGRIALIGFDGEGQLQVASAGVDRVDQQHAAHEGEQQHGDGDELDDAVFGHGGQWSAGWRWRQMSDVADRRGGLRR